MPEPQDLQFLDFERLTILNALIPQKASSVRDITTTHNLRLKLKPTDEEQEELRPDGGEEGQMNLARLASGDFELSPHDALTLREIDFLLDCIEMKQQQGDLPNSDEMFGILMGAPGEPEESDSGYRPGVLEYAEDGRFDV